MPSTFNKFAIPPFFNERLTVQFLDRLRERRIGKMEYLLRAGEICSNLYFVELGALMAYVPTAMGMSVSRLLLEGDVCIVPESFFFQKPSSETIIARKDCFLYYITYTDFAYLQRTYPEFNFIVIDLVLSMLLVAEGCAGALRRERVEIGYRWLEKEYPAIVDTFDDRHLASYLGMTGVALSRIRSHDKRRTA